MDDHHHLFAQAIDDTEPGLQILGATFIIPIPINRLYLCLVTFTLRNECILTPTPLVYSVGRKFY
jgi:hypothetical protein